MAKKKDQRKGIFCLEASGWFGGKDKTTVEPVLRLLKTGYGIPYLRHDVGTRAEFCFYLKKWRGKSFDSHPILYLGFHGTDGGIRVGDGKDNILELSDLAELLGDGCKGRVIHFSSCSTLGVHGHALTSFLNRTGALAVCGFTEDVDWLESAAFDVLVLGYLQEASFRQARSMQKFERNLKDIASRLYKRLGFRMWYGGGK